METITARRAFRARTIASIIGSGLLLIGAGAPRRLSATYVPRRIDGVVVSVQNSNLWPRAVMVDNDPRARPQASLSDASVVYETLAEGGVPRFLALFAKPKLKAIGPVRSVRPYFAELAAEYGAPVFHAGGSRDGLSRLKQLRLPDIDALRRPTARYFYRADRSQSTFNLFTNGVLTNQALTATVPARRSPSYRPWLFEAKSRPKTLPSAQRAVRIDFGSGRSYITEYRYERKTNSYQRFTAGVRQRDRSTGQAVTAKNVVIQFVPKEKLLDRKGHLKVNVLGRGRGILLKDGRSVTVNWKKLTPGQRTVFTLTNDDEVSFRPGPIWIELVPRGKRVTLS